MSSFFTSSIGKKMILSLSGLFLILFLCVHLAANLTLILDNSGDLFNQVCHFMTNPVVRVIEPILGAGLAVHILLAMWLTLENRAARGSIRYSRRDQAGNAPWTSRNMFILGGVILIFLVIHIFNFWWKMKLTGDPLLTEVIIDGVVMENAYALVSGLFKGSVFYCLLYMVGGIFLGLHLSHGFWSAFQSVGLSNDIWRKRLSFLGNLFAIIVGTGFTIIPLYFLLGFGG